MNCTEHEQAFPKEDRIAWIMGCGRTGSTWLLEMVAAFDAIKAWNEPYFGTLLSHLWSTPTDVERVDSFFYQEFISSWTRGLSDALRLVARSRFASARSDDLLVIKEVNAPQIAAFIPDIFPKSKYLLLVRDPFDVLDSYLDMQRPGAWNSSFKSRLPAGDHVLETCRHIRKLFVAAQSGYSRHRKDLRVRVSYENLRLNTSETLSAILEFLGISASAERLAQAIERSQLERHPNTGSGKFRRFGFVGQWRVSPLFDAAVHRLASETLGTIRRELGYSDE